ncbi:hypothetical protein EJK55_0316 [Moraxella catarrhalis]|uniref:Uncharacterized protein n=1 Tax=Moraxella catarrhalis TaxID=480 RepID=A0A3S9QCJ6_MORCA|nr:hypothetical protein EJK53_0648 [Moraxella catarrhalis]RUO13492.1 hypothetical protein EJK54_0258 [Moraxella catarrhalis]RUO15258.1 hypothetical protein EJK55_0316 [Moraxella catarrhalis]
MGVNIANVTADLSFRKLDTVINKFYSYYCIFRHKNSIFLQFLHKNM